MFCRVRPLLPDDGSSGEGKFISYPTSMETLGRAIDLSQSGKFQKRYQITSLSSMCFLTFGDIVLKTCSR